MGKDLHLSDKEVSRRIENLKDEGKVTVTSNQRGVTISVAKPGREFVTGGPDVETALSNAERMVKDRR